MNTKGTRTVIWASVGALALVGLLLVVASAWAGPDRVNPVAPLAPAGVVSSTISYQGRLLQGSTPVNGSRVMTFTLYADAGTPLWSQVHNVAVNNGLFSVNLDVNPGLFDGQALWLGVRVAGDTQELSPRQPILPAPYAISLRPGAIISAMAGFPVLSVINKGNSHAILGSSHAISYPTIWGENTAGGLAIRGSGGIGVEGLGGDIGVSGQSVGGIGVMGYSQNSAGGSFGSANGHALVTLKPSLIQGPNPKQVALLRWYPAIQAPISFTVGANPAGVAFDGANIWVANYGSGDVSVLRANDGYHVMTPTVGSLPVGLAYDGANMWVVNYGSGTVSVLRASDGALVMSPPVGGGPREIAFDGVNMWVTNVSSGTVSVLRVSDGYHVMTPTVSPGPRCIAFDGVNMWVASEYAFDNVKVLRASDGTLMRTLTVSGKAFGIAFDGARMWVTNPDNDTVTVLRASDGFQVAPPLPVGDQPSYIAFDGANMWVVNENEDTVTVLRAADFAFVKTIQVGDNPRGIAFDGANMWIASTDDNRVSKR